MMILKYLHDEINKLIRSKRIRKPLSHNIHENYLILKYGIDGSDFVAFRMVNNHSKVGWSILDAHTSYKQGALSINDPGLIDQICNVINKLK